jgi:hypothetical protein
MFTLHDVEIIIYVSSIYNCILSEISLAFRSYGECEMPNIFPVNKYGSRKIPNHEWLNGGEHTYQLRLRRPATHTSHDTETHMY